MGNRLDLDHQGIILQPEFLVSAGLRSGDLVEVLADYHADELGIHAVYPSRRHLPAKTRSMIDILVDAFRASPWL